MARVVAALLVTLALAGCTSQTGPSQKSFSQKGPGNTNLTLGSLSSWQLRGKIGVRSDHGDANLSFVWDQSPDNYNISLNGTLGVVVAQLSGDANEVILTLPDGNEYHSTRIEDLLEIQLGYQLPVSLLQYWVRGVPDPGFDHETTVDGFDQQGWRVEFLQFGPRGPRKIQVQQADVRLRLVALEWSY